MNSFPSFSDKKQPVLRMAEPASFDIQKLSSQLEDNDPATRSRAALEAGKVNCKAAIPLLVPLLLDGRLRIRKVVSQSLQTLAWEPASNFERAALAIASEQWPAAIALGGDAVPPLIHGLLNFEPVDQRAAAQTLGKMGDQRAVEPLIRALASSDFLVRKAAAEALGQIGDPSATEGLKKAVADPFAQVRLAAMEALVSLGVADVNPIA